jgi:hypothetical protein
MTSMLVPAAVWITALFFPLFLLARLWERGGLWLWKIFLQ